MTKDDLRALEYALLVLTADCLEYAHTLPPDSLGRRRVDVDIARARAELDKLEGLINE